MLNPDIGEILKLSEDFIFAAKSNSFNRANDFAFKNKSTISRNVKALEKLLGFCLFETTPGGIYFTSSGLAYYLWLINTIADISNSYRDTFTPGDSQETDAKIQLSPNVSLFQPFYCSNVYYEMISIHNSPKNKHPKKITPKYEFCFQFFPGRIVGIVDWVSLVFPASPNYGKGNPIPADFSGYSELTGIIGGVDQSDADGGIREEKEWNFHYLDIELHYINDNSPEIIHTYLKKEDLERSEGCFRLNLTDSRFTPSILKNIIEVCFVVSRDAVIAKPLSTTDNEYADCLVMFSVMDLQLIK